MNYFTVEQSTTVVERTMTEFLDAHSIARVIRESEIKSTDIMFKHASCQLDLEMLREFLESYGYYSKISLIRYRLFGQAYRNTKGIVV